MSGAGKNEERQDHQQPITRVRSTKSAMSKSKKLQLRLGESDSKRKRTCFSRTLITGSELMINDKNEGGEERNEINL